MTKETVFLGIAGGSGSGKTYLARQVCTMAGQENAAVISMDQYFRSSEYRSVQDLNFDHPNHLDLDLLVDHLKQLKSGEAVMTPSYDFAKRTQQVEAIRITPKPVIIIEGLFVLSSPVVDLMDMACFLDVADDQRLLGRILRDVSEREHGVNEIVDRYQRFVRPSYHIFVAPSRQNADVVVDFTYRRALFTRMLAHLVSDYSSGFLDLPSLIDELKRENYTLGYQADESIMPIGIDIRKLASAYPEYAFPGSTDAGTLPKLFVADEHA
ncbi:MAG: uridine kinase [Chthonomonas sp.]|nr:uridine kinase [Chthonomonas sp.]